MVAINSAGNFSEVSDAGMVAGVDGIADGWLAVLMQPVDQQHSTRREVRRVGKLRDLIDKVPALSVIAIDIPIGLADVYERGGRSCDRLARSLLSVRRSSVFPTPIRGTLAAATWEEACVISRGSANTGMGLSKQAFGILPKIREIDELLQDHQELRSRVYEVHPELCFRRLAGAPMRHPKNPRKDEPSGTYFWKTCLTYQRSRHRARRFGLLRWTCSTLRWPVGPPRASTTELQSVTPTTPPWIAQDCQW